MSLAESGPDPERNRRHVLTICDVAAIERMDLAVVDALARLALECRREGRDLRLIRASPALCELVELVGLDEVLPLEPER